MRLRPFFPERITRETKRSKGNRVFVQNLTHMTFVGRSSGKVELKANLTVVICDVVHVKVN